MDRNVSGDGRAGSDDAAEARRRVEEAERNRDALAEESRRVEATAPGTAGPRGYGDRPAPAGNGDNVEHVQEAAENRRALEEQARRTQATLPPDVPMRDERGSTR
jgi:hypothetical protein